MPSPEELERISKMLGKTDEEVKSAFPEFLKRITDVHRPVVVDLSNPAHCLGIMDKIRDLQVEARMGSVGSNPTGQTVPHETARKD